MAFRGTMKLLTNFPKPGTPSQIVLNRIKDVGQQQTTEQLWEALKKPHAEHFPNKAQLKRVIDFIRVKKNIQAKPLDHTVKGTKYAWVLTEKPGIVLPDGSGWDEDASKIFPTKREIKAKARAASAEAQKLAEERVAQIKAKAARS